MKYVIQVDAHATLPVIGTPDLFPVGRIFCVGRNYADHAREMGHDPNREPPFFFMKPATALLPLGRDFNYPPLTELVHHEMELVVALGKSGGKIRLEDACEYIYGYAPGLDMTRRDLQEKAKKMGRPWEVGKAFDDSAPCGNLAPASRIGHPSRGAIWLEVNGKRVQESDISQMIWNVSEIVAELSVFFTLRAGDLIFTGTPSGVGPVERGDVLRGGVDQVGELTVRVV